MSRSSQLYELQLIDSLLDQHRNRLAEIMVILADNRKIKQAESELEKTELALKTAEANLRAAERKVKEQRFKVKQTDAKLYGGKIKNPKELQDLQEESQALKRFLGVLEDRQLEKMLEVDEYKQINSAANGVLNEVNEETKIYHKELNQEKSEHELETQRLEIKRKSTIQTINTSDLNVYENLRKKRLGVAVSFVNEKACSACGATLTAALHQAARSPSQVTHCETCGRILFANQI